MFQYQTKFLRFSLHESIHCVSSTYWRFPRSLKEEGKAEPEWHLCYTYLDQLPLKFWYDNNPDSQSGYPATSIRMWALHSGTDISVSGVFFYALSASQLNYPCFCFVIEQSKMSNGEDQNVDVPGSNSLFMKDNGL